MEFLTALSQRIAEHLTWWAVLGLFGQSMFFSRFLLQWLHSERVGRSEIPVAFWFFSVAGGLVTLFYAVHIADLVFIIGQATGLVVYSRNIYLIVRERRMLAQNSAPPLA